MLEKDMDTEKQFMQILDYGYHMGNKVDVSMGDMINELSKRLELLLQPVEERK